MIINIFRISGAGDDRFTAEITNRGIRIQQALLVKGISCPTDPVRVFYDGYDNYDDHDDYSGVDRDNDDGTNDHPMVGRHTSPSAPEEPTDSALKRSTADELPKTSTEKPAADPNSKSPKTVNTSEVAMIIMLMLFAIIGIGVSVCNLSKKHG